MRIRIKTPTKAYLEDFPEKELSSIKKTLSYTDNSAVFMLKKHMKNRWFRDKNPEGWEARLKELNLKKSGSVLFKDEKGFWIRPGSIPYLGKEYDVINEVKYPKHIPIPWKNKPKFEPYDYQKTSSENLLSINHGCVSLATGLGKSLILLILARQIGNCVVVTPSKSIFDELLKSFTDAFGAGKVGGYGDGKKDIKKPITVAIGKSLTTIKPGTPAHQFFKSKNAILVDESHCWSADTLEEVCHGIFSEVPYRFFASATQVNNSGKEVLLESVIGKNVYSMGVEDGINGGYLCPLKFKIINTYSPSTVNKKDVLENRRIHLLRNPVIAELSAKIANSMWNIKGESTLILVEELNQIGMIIPLLKVPFAYAHSGSASEAQESGLQKVDSTKEVERFNKGEVKVLIGTRAIATGTNIFPTHHVINFCGSASEIQTFQGPMGRSTRKLEISKYKDFHKPKPFSTIYDFSIQGQQYLISHLNSRIEFYKQSGGEISFV